MLQRRRKGAIVAAHGQHVEGRIGIVQMALKQLARQGIANRAREHKAAKTSDLSVVLSGKERTQPMPNISKRMWDVAEWTSSKRPTKPASYHVAESYWADLTDATKRQRGTLGAVGTPRTSLPQASRGTAGNCP